MRVCFRHCDGCQTSRGDPNVVFILTGGARQQKGTENSIIVLMGTWWEEGVEDLVPRVVEKVTGLRV